MVALIAALWAYDGWNDLNMVAGEVRNPERNMPLALLFGVGIVGFLYISVNAAIQYMLPAVAVAASPRPAVAAVSMVLGATGATLVTAGMALSIFVTLNGTIMSGARVPSPPRAMASSSRRSQSSVRASERPRRRSCCRPR